MNLLVRVGADPPPPRPSHRGIEIMTTAKFKRQVQIGSVQYNEGKTYNVHPDVLAGIPADHFEVVDVAVPAKPVQLKEAKVIPPAEKPAPVEHLHKSAKRKPRAKK